MRPSHQLHLGSIIIVTVIIISGWSSISIAEQSTSTPRNTKKSLAKNPKMLKSLSSIKTCTAIKNCRDCITASPTCSWCSQEDFSSMYFRCDSKERLENRNCTKGLVAPVSSIHPHRDVPLSHSKDRSRNLVQLKPQKLLLRIRPNQLVRFNISFRQAENYPVDLYFLMDVTMSMEDDKDNLALLGDRIVQDMRRITNDFRLGFGSFVDKVVMPYVDMMPEKLKNPCPDSKDCVAPYGFQNHLPLSNDTFQFKDEVRNAKISANLDDAEGGFDALMQVIVCKDNIKWSNRSRKIVVFATDSNFHYAGDGKLGGIVKPNDEKCHLDTSGKYTESEMQDYPSLSQINRVIKNQKINLIFAVPQDIIKTYDWLSASIEGAHTSVLESDSSNIVDLIRNQYKLIQSEVILTDDAPPEISLRYFTSCKGDGKMEENNRCKNLSIGDTVTFEAQLMLEKCPTDRKNRTLRIYPVGLNEILEIQLEMFCDCDCAVNSVVNSTKCQNVGNYECGICNCPEGRFGRQCECSSGDVDKMTSDDGDENCKIDGVGPTCSNRGDCICGQCECYSPTSNVNHTVHGKYCECDNFSCDRATNREICGGPKRGECYCGNCTCHTGYKGDACDCRDTTKTCKPMDSTNEVLCSGHGSCVCGVCQCDYSSGRRWGGPYCEECPSCNEKCSMFRACVECQTFGQGAMSQEECKNCTVISKVVDKLNETPTDRKCVFTDDQNCAFTFTYDYDSNQIPIVRVHKFKDCPREVNAAAIGIGIAAAIVLIGLAILFIARFLIYVKDRRDYARFMEDTKKAVWADENPIYKKAKINYKNPIYKKES